MTVTDHTRAHCRTCRRPFKKTGGAKCPRLACARCGVSAAPVQTRRGRTGCQPPARPVLYTPAVQIVARPVSLCCRRVMWQQGHARGKRIEVRWTCPCRRSVCPVITSAGEREKRRPAETYNDARPGCPACLRAMRREGRRHGRQLWRCRNCPGVASEADAADLLASIDSKLPKYLPADAREDARQEMALAILEGRRLDRRDINRIAAASLGVTQSRYSRVYSLDVPIPGADGLTYAQTLIG